MLLSVERPADLLRGYRFVSALARRDNQQVARFRADLQAFREQREILEKKTQESLALRDPDRAGAPQPRRGSAAQDRASHHPRGQEGAAGRLRPGAGGGGRASSRPCSRAWAERARSRCPSGPSGAALPWPAPGRVRVSFGKRKDARFDTYTRENGIEIAARRRGAGGGRARGRGGLRRALQGLRPHGRARPRRASTTRSTPTWARSRVALGQRVAAGEVLGTVGPGGLEGPGLYFEMRFQGRPEDPVDWLSRRRAPTQASATWRSIPRTRSPLPRPAAL